MTGPAFVFTWNEAFAFAAILAGFGTILHSLELLAIRQDFDSGGLLCWRVLRTAHPRLLRSGFGPIADHVLSPPGYVLVILFQLISAAQTVLKPSDPPIWALCVLLAGRTIFNFRNSQTLIGADQMQLVVWTACLVSALLPDSIVRQICGWFVCLQLILAYVTSGVWKLLSPDWRSGMALRDVVRTRTMGLGIAYAWLRRFSSLSFVACWATIVVECVFPWLVFTGSFGCLVFLATCLVFHIAVAAVMGLDEFLWAYASAYPITLRCSLDFERFWMG